MARSKYKPIKDVVFDELTHRYIYDGKVLTGITTLMKHQGLSPDYSDISEETLNDAAFRGTAVHNLLEAYSMGEPAVCADVFSETSGKLLQSADEQKELLASFAKLGLDVFAVEMMVTDYRVVASFIDLVLADGSIIDIKTSSSLHTESVSWQLSFYAYLLEKLNPKLKVPHLFALHARGGKCKLVEVERKPDAELEEYIQAESLGVVYKPNRKDEVREFFPTEYETVRTLTVSVTDLKARLKEAESQLKEYEDKIYEYMLANNKDTIEGDGVTITLKRPYTRESIDSARLKKERPEIAEQYTKTSEVKGNITIKIQ